MKKVYVSFITLLTFVLITGCDKSYDSKLNLSIIGNGTVHISQNGPYSVGDEVTLIASPAEGHHFYRYTGDIASTMEEITITFGEGDYDIQAIMPIYVSPDEAVVINTVERPIFVDDGVDFTADLSFSSSYYDNGDSYYFWIMPFSYDLNTPNNENPLYFYTPSGPLNSKTSNVIRGGWLGYYDADSNFIYANNGKVYQWRYSYRIRNADGSWDVDSEVDGFFSYTVDANN